MKEQLKFIREELGEDDFDEEVSAEEIVIIKKCVAEAAKEYKKA